MQSCIKHGFHRNLRCFHPLAWSYLMLAQGLMGLRWIFGSKWRSTMDPRQPNNPTEIQRISMEATKLPPSLKETPHCFPPRPPELRKKTSHIYFYIWRLIWGACAKGKCWFAKARESKSAPRKPRKLTCGSTFVLGIWYCKSAKGSRKMCERFAKAEVFKSRSPPICTKWANRQV